MKHYVALTLLMIGTFLVFFALAEWLEIPLLTGTAPLDSFRGGAAALVGMGLLTMDVVLPVPASLVMVAHGAFFGLVAGSVISLVGSLCAASLGFLIGRSGVTLIEKLVPEAERRRVNSMLADWGGLAIVVSRPLPILAESVVILAGTSNLTWARMLAATFVGALPVSVVYAFAGSTAAKFNDTVLIFSSVVVLAGIFWFVGRYLRFRDS